MITKTKILCIEHSLAASVIAWANDRNLISGCGPKDQALKLGSEVGEIYKALADCELAELIDGIGDSMVVSIIVSEQIGRPLLDAIEEVSVEELSELTDRGAPYLFISSSLGLVQDFILKGVFDKASFHMARMAVHLANLAAEHAGIELNECLRRAYEVIKDRKGVMFNGSFIKDSDPQYANAVAQIEEKRLADAEVLTRFAAL